MTLTCQTKEKMHKVLQWHLHWRIYRHLSFEHYDIITVMGPISITMFPLKSIGEHFVLFSNTYEHDNRYEIPGDTCAYINLSVESTLKTMVSFN